MKIKSIIAFGVALIIGMTSCIHTQVDDNHDAFENAFLSDSQKEALSKKFASAFSYDNGSNHSNKVTVVNNTGYDCRLDYMVGTLMLGSGKDNKVDVVVPFAGDLMFKATVLYNGAFIDVDIPVHVDVLDNELDPLFVALTDGSAEGKTWQWWVGYDYENGNYSYIDGSWGCVGGGGYGWSATGPNWLCYGIGQNDDWTGQAVTMDEWVKVDLDGGPNVIVHYSDGTEKKGTFTLISGTTPEKAALGWTGTMKLSVELPHQITPGQSSWYLDLPAEFDVVLTPEDPDHLILIAPGGGGEHIICDDSWAISSTHWTFQVKKE